MFDIRHYSGGAYHSAHGGRGGSSVLLHENVTKEEAARLRELSGDVVVHAGTDDVVAEGWWLFDWEKRDPDSFARRAQRFADR